MMHLRNATEADLPAILEIHNDAVRNLDAIWSDKLESLDTRRDWMRERLDAGFPVIVVADEDNGVLGFGSYGPYRPKDGYRFTVDHSVYVAASAQGRGAGKILMAALIERARTGGFHVMVGGIDAGNTVSIKFHAAFGFKEAGRLPQVGAKFGRWLDLVQMALVLDDRERPPAN
ncbi:GNAT family N-acetyltransferase [Roseibium algae]|uniref:N-acetyltransferase family protein n=1 Tax=Roseibium algae TaxID=3123038 RepID=A0ABU8TQ09_9HYPH